MPLRRLMIACLTVLLGLSGVRAAAPFGYADLSATLTRYVDDAGRVDYLGLRADRAGLDAFVARVARTSPASDPAAFPTAAERLAYYINAYNALALTGVLDRPGIRSVTTPGLRFFSGTLYTVGGARMDLDTLESREIRGAFHDPRVHFAVNCQSLGCPKLKRTAWEPARLDADLDAAARAFCTDPAQVYADAAGTWHVSSIFDWYKSDFAATGVPGFIRAHGGATPDGARLVYLPYDWSLAAQPGRAP